MANLTIGHHESQQLGESVQTGHFGIYSSDRSRHFFDDAKAYVSTRRDRVKIIGFIANTKMLFRLLRRFSLTLRIVWDAQGVGEAVPTICGSGWIKNEGSINTPNLSTVITSEYTIGDGTLSVVAVSWTVPAPLPCMITGVQSWDPVEPYRKV